MPQPTPYGTVLSTPPKRKTDSETDSKFGLYYGRFVVADATGDMAERERTIPMPIAIVAVRAMTDTRITSLTALQAFGIMSCHSDEWGTIHPMPDGKMVTDPEYLSRVIGVTKAAIYRAYAQLNTLGYIDWRKAAMGAERKNGKIGQVRIIVPPSAHA